MTDTLHKLHQSFAQFFDKSGAFDLRKFKQELTDEQVNFSTESYGMDWLGKSYARLLASDKRQTLLREDRAFNQQADNQDSNNLLIKGDNLEVLKHLAGAYYEKVKMIYIDPPYNTGSDGFVYADDRRFSVAEFSQLSGVDEEVAKRILSFVNSKSNSHSAWLTFMYPRLYIARQLLRDDGVIFVSIDDNEMAQLKIMMDEVFGEENFVGTLIHQRAKGGGQAKQIVKGHDYIVCYSRNESSGVTLRRSKVGEQKTINIDGTEYLRNDDYIRKSFGKYDKSLGDRRCFYEEIEKYKGKAKKDEIDALLSSGEIKLEKNKHGMHTIVQYIPVDTATSKLYSIIKVLSEEGKNDLIELGIKGFDYPKPKALLTQLIESVGVGDKNDLILDFFAGSGTTGDAVMQLNADDGGKRQYILVQLPELIDQKKSKVAYDFVHDELGVAEPTIFEITKERLLRAGAKIKESHKDWVKQGLDLGFKVFETMPIWSDYEPEAEKLASDLSLFDEGQLTEADLQALLTTWKTDDGFALTLDLLPVDLAGYTGYYCEGRLYLMHRGFGTDQFQKLLELIDADSDFNPTHIVAFAYHFESKMIREMSENIKSYANKKHIDIDFKPRY